MKGSLSGANNFVGLEEKMDEVNDDINAEALWTRHTCRDCAQLIDIGGGQLAQVRAAVVDGITAPRFPKCAVKYCTNDLSRTVGAR